MRFRYKGAYIAPAMVPARCHPSADTQCPCYCAQFARGRPNSRSPRALEQLTAKCTWNYWNHPVDRPGARSRASSRHPRLVPPPGRPLRAMPVPEAETARSGRPAAGPRHGLRAQFAPAPHRGHTRAPAAQKLNILSHGPPHAIPPAAAAATRRFRPLLQLHIGNSAISAPRCRMAIPVVQRP